MSDYYEMRFESLMIRMEQFENPYYRRAEQKLREAEDALAELIGTVGMDGWRLYERCIDACNNIDGFHCKMLYLCIAEDREKMLR